MMNLNLPSGGLGRGRVWRSQGWAGGQPSKPWLGTLNSGLSESGRGGRSPVGGCGSCSWARGNDLPYIQQRCMSESADNFGDFCLPLPSPTSEDPHHQLQQQQQPKSRVTSSAVAADEVIDDFKRYNESFEIPGSLYVLLVFILAGFKNNNC